MKRYGYNGKSLFVDLTTANTEVFEFDLDWYRIYGGGGLLGAYFLLKNTGPGIDPFSPENLLIFTSSIIAGIEAPGLARFSVVTKSPLSFGIAETRCEGPFGTFLKGSGYDALVISGRSPRPVYLFLNNGEAGLRDAGDLWGNDTRDTTRKIQEEHAAGTEISIAAIGPAGENLVRYASVVADGSIQAMRMGVGAVMGSKNLKAVALKGNSPPPIFDSNLVDHVKTQFRKAMEQNTLSMWQKEPPGFSAYIDLSDVETAYMGINNYTDNLHEVVETLGREKFRDYYKGDITCPGCPNDCIKVLDPGSGYPESAGIHQEVSAALGPNIGNTDLKILLEANVLCNRFGLDPVSLGFTLSYAMECFEKGYITSEDTGGIDLRFGNIEVVLPVIEQISKREGVGDALAEGVKRCVDHFGGETADCALHVKGIEMVSFEPRTMTNLALGYATAPIGPRYDICEHDWDFDTQAGWDHSLNLARTLGILQRIPMEYVGPDKVRNYKVLNTIWSACDALDLCVFASAPTRSLTLEMMSALIHGITGWETSSYEFMRWGERRNHLMRVYNLREGMTTEDDTLPDRFFTQPIRQGRQAGTVLDKKTFSDAVKTYYRMMGWDDDGIPRAETLIEHHLDWAVPIVERMGD